MTIYAITIPFRAELFSDTDVEATISSSGLKLHPNITPVFSGEASIYHVKSDGRPVKQIQDELGKNDVVLITHRQKHP